MRCDPTRIRQIVLNIVSNAVKFTEPAGTITLTGYRSEDGLVLEIADTGIGIAADDIDTVLEPFGQVASAYARNHQGTGLGLSLTKALVEQHGGQLSIDSNPGDGTRVTVWLPAERLIDTALSESA